MQRDPADPHNPPDEVMATMLIATEGIEPEEHAKKIEELLRGREGVREVQADLENARVIVTFDTRKTHAPEIHESILRGGYKASPTT